MFDRDTIIDTVGITASFVIFYFIYIIAAAADIGAF